jgi:hypothetical protein
MKAWVNAEAIFLVAGCLFLGAGYSLLVTGCFLLGKFFKVLAVFLKEKPETCNQKRATIFISDFL